MLDHPVVVGEIYWQGLQKGVRTPLAGGVLTRRDIDLLWYGIDRTDRETALASETPKGEVRDLRAALAQYRRHRARLLDYVKTTKDDLRNGFVARQGCDAYQWALSISTHEQRHILQIREIKADSKFPRKWPPGGAHLHIVSATVRWGRVAYGESVNDRGLHPAYRLRIRARFARRR